MSEINGYALIEFLTKDGDTFTIPSYIDQWGVRRFFENKVITLLNPNLNNLAVLMHHANPPMRDIITFYASLGYSVDGMCDLSFMRGVQVITPEWTQD